MDTPPVSCTSGRAAGERDAHEHRPDPPGTIAHGNRPTVLLLGASGQLGQALRATLSSCLHLVAADRHQADLRQPAQLGALIAALRPQLIVNAAAYTAVDLAQAPHTRAAVHAVNAVAPGLIAQYGAQVGAAIIHYSTDYVFDGCQSRPYVETDAAHPLSVYGQSKLVGEQAVAAANPRHLILRTCWLHSPWGTNFLKTILARLQAGQPLRVVDDQFGTPTGAIDLARVSGALAAQALAAVADPARSLPWGTYHVSAQGRTSWYAYAGHIARCAQDLGLLGPGEPALAPVPSRDYPQRAPRPANAILDSGKLHRHFGLALPDWRDGVAATLARLRDDTPERLPS